MKCFPHLLIILLAVALIAADTNEKKPVGESGKLVDLDARDASAAADVWKNRGSLGNFSRVGGPKVQKVDGVKAVVFDGKQDMYIGPVTPAALEGNAPRTIEAWVINPRIDAPAETIVSWGKGGAEAERFSLNIGLMETAVSLAESGAGLPWGEDHPMEDQWHHLVVTYDGKAYKLYDNGSKRRAAPYVLKTAAGQPIVIAALNGADGKGVFELPKLAANGKPDPKGGVTQVGGSIALAALRIHARALTHEQVIKSFNADAKRFGAVALDLLDAQRSPRPTALASTFSFGYGPDHMPQDNAKFEQLLKTIKDLGFNVIHVTYTPQRLALCKKHEIKMMVDTVSGTDHHVFATPIKWKQVAVSLRGNPDVWGYNLWNDPFGNQGGTLRTHIRSLRLWDPTHPAYCGTYHWPAAAAITNGDMPGYYDFHWERGIKFHLNNCRIYLNAARRNKGMWGTWLSTKPGKAGTERVNRSLWSANIGMAHGLKCILWFLGQDIVDPKTLVIKPDGKDFAAIHAEIMPLKNEIMKIGNPVAVYSTAMTRDMLDKPVAGNATAPRLPAFPKEFLAEPLSGEFIAGVFEEKPNSVTLFVANYNAYAPQAVKLKLIKAGSASIFDRKKGLWRKLQVTNGTVEFPLAPGGGELLRFNSGTGTAVFDSLKTDADTDKWLRDASATYAKTVKDVESLKGVRGFRFATKKDLRAGRVAWVDGVLEIQLAAKLRGPRRISTLIFEMANTRYYDQHQAIDLAVDRGLIRTPEEFGLAHEIYEYEALKIHRQILVELASRSGDLPQDFFYLVLPAPRSIADYRLPDLYQYLKTQKEAGHTAHYYKAFDRRKQRLARAKQTAPTDATNKNRH